MLNSYAIFRCGTDLEPNSMTFNLSATVNDFLLEATFELFGATYTILITFKDNAKVTQANFKEV